MVLNIFSMWKKTVACNIKMKVKEKSRQQILQILNSEMENPMIYNYCNHHEDMLRLCNVMVILCLLSIIHICWMLYVNVWRFKHVCGSFVMQKSKQHSCNMIFLIITKDICISGNNGFLNLIYRPCYIKTYRLSTFVVSCLLGPFLPFKNKRDLVRNFWIQTFASFDASSASFSMIPTWSD